MTSPLTRPVLSVLVHGATGTQGAPVVRRLLADGHRVRALVRREASLPEGVDAVLGDLDDPASLVRAYTGVDAVVVQLPLVFDPARAEAQAQAVLSALAEAEVSRAVLNVGGPLVPVPVGVPYLDARSALATGLPSAVGVASVVGPAGPYLENLSAAWSAPQVREGTLAYPLPASAAVPWLALDDLADAVAEALVAEAPPARQVLAGPEALTGDQLADAVAAGVGREVVYRTVSHTEYGDRMTPHVGEEAGRGIAGFYAPPPPGAPGLPAPDPSLLRTGRTTVREWAARQRW